MIGNIIEEMLIFFIIVAVILFVGFSEAKSEQITISTVIHSMRCIAGQVECPDNQSIKDVISLLHVLLDKPIYNVSFHPEYCNLICFDDIDECHTRDITYISWDMYKPSSYVDIRLVNENGTYNYQSCGLKFYVTHKRFSEVSLIYNNNIVWYLDEFEYTLFGTCRDYHW